MKIFLEIIQLIVLILICIIFVLYIFSKNKSDKAYNKIVEKFQVEDEDIHTPMFDVSANYYSYTDSENGDKTLNPDMTAQILNIGGSFGEIDMTQIPWDSENKELTVAEALWGFVPRQASLILFHKMYNVAQLDSKNELPFDPNNNQHYDDPLFMYGTDNVAIADTLMAVNAIAQLALPMIGQHIANDPIDAALARKSQAAKVAEKDLFDAKKAFYKSRPQGNSGLKIASEADVEAGIQKEVNKILEQRTKAATEFAENVDKRVATAAEEAVKKADQKLAGLAEKKTQSLFRIKYAKYIDQVQFITRQLTPSVLIKLFKDLKFTVNKVGKPFNAAIRAAKNAIMDSLKGNAEVIKKAGDAARTAAESSAKAAGKTAAEIKAAGNVAENAAHTAQRAELKAIAKIESLKPFSQKLASAMAEQGAKKGWKVFKLIGGKVMGCILKTPLLLMSLGWIFPPYWLYIGKFLDTAYMFTVMPLLMTLMIPGNPIQAALDNFGKTDGCCPAGSKAFDEAIPEWANTIISLLPISGDLIGMLYPIGCMVDGVSGGLVGKQNLVLPKYLNYAWLSSYYFNWPEYDCTHGSSRIQGKYNDTTRCDIDTPNIIADIADSIGTLGLAFGSDSLGNIYGFGRSAQKNQWTCGPYTDFNDVINDPLAHHHTRKQLDGLKPKYDEFYIVPPGSNFFYCDFSHPNKLLEMAQYYYDQSYRNPSDNGDGTATIQFISKINYVVASSLVTCDVFCEMINVTYNIIDGTKYNEVVSYDHDRRFYFSGDPTYKGPPYWETATDSSWRNIDDAYDNAVICVNSIIHTPPFINTGTTVELVATAYRLMIRSSNNYENAISNATTLQDLEPFYTHKTYDSVNFENLIEHNLKCSNTALAVDVSANFVGGKIGVGFTLGSFTQGAVSGQNYGTVPKLDTNAITNLKFYLSSMVGCSNAYWEYQKTLPSQEVTSNLYSNYVVTGCTYIDCTAGGAVDPVVPGGEEDSRKEVNFPTTQLLKRCTNHFMDMGLCIDLSNISTIIASYSAKYPETHIKVIKSIKPKGQNVCQYIWDEVKIDPVSQVETNYSNVTNNILYQIDISSCTFCLPSVDNNKQLYGTTVNSNIKSDTLGPPPETVLLYNNPTSIYSPNHVDNVQLPYKKAFYYLPIIGNANGSNPETDGIIIGATQIFDVDDIERYHPNDGSRLPELIRPKNPIRIHYPKPTEKTLGNESNNICSFPEHLNNFILDYNSVNTSNKITKVIRSYTTSSNICDMEVDILSGNNIQRKTISYTMKEKQAEGFTTKHFSPPSDWIPPKNFPTVQYANGGWGNLSEYTYKSEIKSQQGLNIQADTHGLPGMWSTIGYGFSKPYLSTIMPKVTENNVYFNDDLIKNFTNTTVGLKNTTNRLLVTLAGTQHLGTANCSNLCSDPEIRQRIIEQYNIDGYPKTRLDVSQNTMLNIVAAATASSNKCHLVFENQNDSYGDSYSKTTYIGAASNRWDDPSSNYTTVNNLYLKEVTMKQLPGTCSFLPVAAQEYNDISATDLALSTQFDMESLSEGKNLERILPKNPVRDTCSVNCGNPNLINQGVKDYMSNTNNIIDNIYAYMSVGYDTCDYYVNNKIYNAVSAQGDAPYEDIEGILRIKYTYPYYNGASNVCDEFTYTPISKNNGIKSYQMQVPGDTLTPLDTDISPMFDYMIDPMLQDKDNINLKPFISLYQYKQYKTSSQALSNVYKAAAELSNLHAEEKARAAGLL